MTEEWKAIPDTNLRISSLGRVVDKKGKERKLSKCFAKDSGWFSVWNKAKHKQEGRNIFKLMEELFIAKRSDENVVVFPDNHAVDIRLKHEVQLVCVLPTKNAKSAKPAPQFNVNDLQVVEYAGQRVLTTEQLAQAYECKPLQIQQNFNNSKEYFKEDEHFFKVEGEKLKSLYFENFESQNFSKTRVLYLWTRKGAVLHCKMLRTVKAWEMFNTLVNSYFDKQEKTANPAVSVMNLLSDPKNVIQFLQAYADTKDENKRLLVENATVKAENENLGLENMALQNSVERQNVEIGDLKDQVAVEKFFQVGKDKLYSVRMIALSYDWSSQELNDWLKTKGIQYYDPSAHHWALHQKYRKRDLARVTYYEYQEGKYRPSLKWTKKGLSFIFARLRESGIIPVAARESMNQGLWDITPHEFNKTKGA